MTAQTPKPETTELERRVLANERVLQAIIEYMSRTEPRFMDHLRKRFVAPSAPEAHEQDRRNADDCAGEFIRGVIRLGESADGVARPASGVRNPATPDRERPDATAAIDPPVGAERVKVGDRSGVWEVRVDGVFKGDYHQKEHALAAAALMRLSNP